jgi:hypothetical protein
MPLHGKYVKHNRQYRQAQKQIREQRRVGYLGKRPPINEPKKDTKDEQINAGCPENPIEINVVGFLFQRLVVVSEPVEYLHEFSILLEKGSLRRIDCFAINSNQFIQDIPLDEV